MGMSLKDLETIPSLVGQYQGTGLFLKHPNGIFSNRIVAVVIVILGVPPTRAAIGK
jgi:hypothetical protein